jgi:hypothetical protein
MSRKRRLEDLVREGELRRRRLAEETDESKAAAAAAAKDAGKRVLAAGAAAVAGSIVAALGRRRRAGWRGIVRSLRPRSLPAVVLETVLGSEKALAMIVRAAMRFAPKITRRPQRPHPPGPPRDYSDAD